MPTVIGGPKRTVQFTVGIPVGGAGRALVEPFAQGLLKQFRFALLAGFPVSTYIVIDQQFVVK